jgi:VanZ family protein
MRAKRWIIAVLYVAFIYATLNVAPAPLRFLRSLNLLRLTLTAVYLAGLGYLMIRLLRHPKYTAWRMILLVGVWALYPLFARFTTSPEEQLHFFEYGLVGVLFARALRADGPRTRMTYIGAGALGTLAGWLDEVLQGLLPNRHYDVRDIALNAVSVALGLVIYALTPSKESLN